MNNYKKVLNEIVARRKEELDRAFEDYNQILKTNARIYEIERSIRKLTLLEIKENKDYSGKIAPLKKEKAELFALLGLSDSPVIPPPKCAICSDTGLVSGGFCECVKHKAILEDENIALPLRYFSDSNPLIVKAQGLESIYSTLKIFTEKFPLTKNKNIILLGATGTGKSFLAQIVAGEILLKGYSVVCLTAFGLLQKMLGYHTSFDSGKEDILLPLLDCDLLVIDDLGTESILKNVTKEYLYIIINERTIKGKHTLITSNLSALQIATRYGERVESRLFDKNICLSKVFSGKDLRQLPKENRV